MTDKKRERVHPMLYLHPGTYIYQCLIPHDNNSYILPFFIKEETKSQKD